MKEVLWIDPIQTEPGLIAMSILQLHHEHSYALH